MKERDLAEQFNRAWEQANGARGGIDAPDEVNQALETARQLALADFSHESRVRDSLRRRLLSGERSNAERPPVARRTLQALLWVLGTTAWVSAIVLLVLGFGWVLRTLLPSGAPASRSISQAPPFTPTGAPAVLSPLPTVEVGLGASGAVEAPPEPLATATPLPENPVYYTVKEGDTLASIADQTGVPVETLKSLNNISPDSSELAVGMQLIVGFEAQALVTAAAPYVTVLPGSGEVSLRAGPGTKPSAHWRKARKPRRWACPRRGIGSRCNIPMGRRALPGFSPGWSA